MTDDKEKKPEDDADIVSFGAQLEQAYMNFCELIRRYNDPNETTKIGDVIRYYDHVKTTFFKPSESADLLNIHGEYRRLCETKAYSENMQAIEKYQTDEWKRKDDLADLKGQIYYEACENAKQVLGEKLRSHGLLDQYSDKKPGTGYRG